jgi:glycosyltransferase involved in cell wall biosynthesis
MKKKPAIVITYPFPLGGYNGGARMTREIALEFGRIQIPVYLMPVSARLRSQFPRRAEEAAGLGFNFDDQLAQNEVSIIRVKPHILHSFLDGLKVRQTLKQLLKERPVAAVFSYFHEGIFLPSFLKSKNIPFLIIAIWQSYERALKLPSKIRKPNQFLDAYIKRRMIINTYKQADHFFAISNHTGRELVKFMDIDPERITTSYLGVSPEFSKLPRPKPDKIRRFVFFGRVTPSKGIPDAIKALSRLKQMGYNDWEYHIKGDGYLEWARSLITESNLEKHIFLHKPSIDTNLHHFLSDGHLLLMPSHHESFGLSFAEAQAAGMPVIGYAADSVTEVVADGRTGWLAQTGDIEQLTALLVNAIENPEQSYEFGLNGRERVKQLFTWEKTADAILNDLNPILNRHKK